MPSKKQNKKQRSKRGGGGGKKDEDHSIPQGGSHGSNDFHGAFTAGSATTMRGQEGDRGSIEHSSRQTAYAGLSRDALVANLFPIIPLPEDTQGGSEDNASPSKSNFALQKQNWKQFDIDWHLGYICPKNNPKWSLCRNIHLLAAEWESCSQHHVSRLLQSKVAIDPQTVYSIAKRTRCNECRHSLVHGLQDVFQDSERLRQLLEGHSVLSKLQLSPASSGSSSFSRGSNIRLTLPSDLNPKWVDELLNTIQKYSQGEGATSPPWYAPRLEPQRGTTGTATEVAEVRQRTSHSIHYGGNEGDNDIDFNTEGVAVMNALYSRTVRAVDSAGETAKYIETRKAILGKDENTMMAHSDGSAAILESGSSLETAQRMLHDTHDQYADIIRDTARLSRSLRKYSSFLREHLISALAAAVKRGEDPGRVLPKRLLSRLHSYLDSSACNLDGSLTTQPNDNLTPPGINVKEYISQMYSKARSIGQGALESELNQSTAKSSSLGRTYSAIGKINVVADVFDDIAEAISSVCSDLRKLCCQCSDRLSGRGIDLANDYGLICYIPTTAEFFAPSHELRPCQFFTSQGLGCTNSLDACSAHSSCMQKVEVSELSFRKHIHCAECGETINICSRDNSPHWTMWDEVLCVNHEQTSKKANNALQKYSKLWRADMLAIQGRLLASIIQKGLVPLRDLLSAHLSHGSVFRDLMDCVPRLIETQLSRRQKEATHADRRRTLVNECLKGEPSGIHFWLGTTHSLQASAKRTANSFWHKILETFASSTGEVLVNGNDMNETGSETLRSALCASFDYLEECSNKAQCSVTLPFRFPIESVRVDSVRWAPYGHSKERQFSSLSQVLPFLGFPQDAYVTSRALCLRIMESRVKQWIHALIFASSILFDIWHVVQHSVPASQIERQAWKTDSRHVEQMFELNPESHLLLRTLAEVDEHLRGISDDDKLKQEISREYRHVVDGFGKNASSYDTNILRASLASSKGFSRAEDPTNRWATVATRNIECMRTEQMGLGKAYTALVDAVTIAERQMSAMTPIFCSIEYILSTLESRKAAFCRSENLTQHFQWILYDSLLQHLEDVDELYKNNETSEDTRLKSLQARRGAKEHSLSRPPESERKQTNTSTKNTSSSTSQRHRLNSAVVDSNGVSVVEIAYPEDGYEENGDEQSSWVTVSRSRKSQSTTRKNKRRNKRKDKSDAVDHGATAVTRPPVLPASESSPSLKKADLNGGKTESLTQPTATIQRGVTPSGDTREATKEVESKARVLGSIESRPTINKARDADQGLERTIHPPRLEASYSNPSCEISGGAVAKLSSSDAAYSMGAQTDTDAKRGGHPSKEENDTKRRLKLVSECISDNVLPAADRQRRHVGKRSPASPEVTGNSAARHSESSDHAPPNMNGKRAGSTNSNSIAEEVEDLCNAVLGSNDENLMQSAAKFLKDLVEEHKPRKGEPMVTSSLDDSQSLDSKSPAENTAPQRVKAHSESHLQPVNGIPREVSPASLQKTPSVTAGQQQPRPSQSRGTTLVHAAAVQDIRPRPYGVRMIGVDNAVPTVPWYEYPQHIFEAPDATVPVWLQR
eukprot:gb/GECG01014303.1/.p1 GENE.gb/GECG01014303.1/~~gb/GECG01014303.1/.p1  ORF type:complete len:1571 (+),score=205.83 gb/GECG01014303.1/:1-4713(+)